MLHVGPRATASRRSALFLGLLSLLSFLFLPVRPALAQEPGPPTCEGDSAFHRLDFWIGSWDVRAEGRKVGENRIEKIVGGCALLEHWTSAAGGEGKSLFYLPPNSEWKQVWVTPRAMQPGGVKEKSMEAGFEGPGVRFQGRIALPGGGSYLDRTTLTPRDDGTVRQVIETSSDAGETWQVRFDAIYVPSGGSWRARRSGEKTGDGGGPAGQLASEDRRGSARDRRGSASVRWPGGDPGSGHPSPAPPSARIDLNFCRHGQLYERVRSVRRLLSDRPAS